MIATFKKFGPRRGGGDARARIALATPMFVKNRAAGCLQWDSRISCTAKVLRSWMFQLGHCDQLYIAYEESLGLLKALFAYDANFSFSLCLLLW